MHYIYIIFIKLPVTVIPERKLADELQIQRFRGTSQNQSKTSPMAMRKKVDGVSFLWESLAVVSWNLFR